MSAVDWIDEYLHSNALLAGTTVQVEDHTILSDDVYWVPEHFTDYQQVIGLASEFTAAGYDVRWTTRINFPDRTRGTVYVIPEDTNARFYFLCAVFDSKLNFSSPCTVVQRYRHDDEIFISTIVWRPAERWAQFDRLVEEIDRLVGCLDVTDSFKGADDNLNVRSRNALLELLENDQQCGPPYIM